MNEGQQRAVDIACNGHNLVITGAIGTGKTSTVSAIIRRLKSAGRNVAITASTGLASQQIQVAGVTATTLHSWSGMRDNRYTNEQLIQLLKHDSKFRSATQRIVATDTLIIDEISMISAKVFGQLEFICRIIRNTEKLFGGLQVVAAGDFSQLKPVPNVLYQDPGDYCFSSQAWKGAMQHVAILSQVVRQEDPVLVTAIRELASGSISHTTDQFLKSLSRPLVTHEPPVYLYAHNFDVMMTCYDFLHELPGEERIYRAKDTGNTKRLSDMRAPKILVLKKGAKVMLTTNMSSKLVNGIIGEVSDLDHETCTVNFENVGAVIVSRYLFTVFSQEDGKDVASRSQLPLQLAYAITIHKAQGMTLESVVVDARHATNPGQLATAIGRVKRKEGLQLLNYNKINIPKQPSSVIEFQTQVDQCDLNINIDHSCCKNANTILDADIQVDFPLGHEPLVYFPPLENDQGSSDDVIEEWDEHACLDDFLLGGVELISVLPIDFNITDFRSLVSQSFKRCETPSQVSLFEIDKQLHDGNISIYLGHIWQLLQQSAKDLPKEAQFLQNKDFSKIVKAYDSFLNSREHVGILTTIFQHPANDIEHKLCFMYASALINMFLSSVARSMEKETERVTMPSVPSDESRSAIRYLAGMCVAKESYRQRNIAWNNMHRRGEREVVKHSRCRKEMLEILIVPQHAAQVTTNDPASLDLTIRKQNVRLGLTHVTDDTFQFFGLVDDELNCHVSRNNMEMYKGNLFPFATQKLLSSSIIQEAWKSLFWPKSYSSEFMENFMQSTITPYIHVKCNQFRKDFLDKERDTKSLEIRKALWQKPKAAVMQRRKESYRMQSTSREGDSTSLSALKDLCMAKTSSALIKFKKEQLVTWCGAYGITPHKKWNKSDMAKKIHDAVIACSANGSSSSCQESSSSNVAYQEEVNSASDDDKCPKCLDTYMEDTMWVGCDNKDCGLFICRSCAGLQCDSDYTAAVGSIWTCPFCA